MSELPLFLSLFFVPITALGVAGFWITYRYWWPLMTQLDISRLNRGITRRILFAGCSNATPEITVELNRARRAYALLYALFLVFAAMFLGWGAVVFFVIFLMLNFATATPYELPEKQT